MITILNLIHFRCPDTILMLKKKIKSINKKNEILVLTNDIATKWDIPRFCKFMNYKLININIKNVPYKFLIQKI
ncbi:sulfurtransferase TusA family protein [Buchnera aphidicola]|uniref:sulfurtransferase TusA family protein n=1 Tax=Buchnera aphidicola TaxID=9 RepID=UPI0034649C66